MQKFYTHDNGGRPFEVCIRNNEIVEIYKSTNGVSYDEKIANYYPTRIFIGKSPHGPEFEGNSILLEIDKNKYIFIGHVIYEFHTKYPIVTYISSMGPSDVPYPYAIDTQWNFYLMIEDVIIKNQVSEDPYDWYYRNKYMGGINLFDATPDIMTDILTFHIGDDAYMLSHNIHPKRQYRSHVKEGPLKITRKNGSTEILTEESYVKLMKEYGAKLGVKKMKKRLLHTRIW